MLTNKDWQRLLKLESEYKREGRKLGRESIAAEFKVGGRVASSLAFMLRNKHILTEDGKGALDHRTAPKVLLFDIETAPM